MRAASLKPRFGQPSVARNPEKPDRYKWVALSNTTVGISMATIDSSIVLISLPAIFRGIGLNPLVTSNTGYLEASTLRPSPLSRLQFLPEPV